MKGSREAVTGFQVDILAIDIARKLPDSPLQVYLTMDGSRETARKCTKVANCLKKSRARVYYQKLSKAPPTHLSNGTCTITMGHIWSQQVVFRTFSMQPLTPYMISAHNIWNPAGAFGLEHVREPSFKMSSRAPNLKCRDFYMQVSRVNGLSQWQYKDVHYFLTKTHIASTSEK